MKKKISLILALYLVFVTKVKASNTFYLGEHVPNIYIYMNRINKQVYRQFREIYTTDTNELVYCIEPGQTLSGGEYSEFLFHNDIFNLNSYQWERIKKIGYYGYLYNDHTDIKWYAITQYLIWKETMPSNWELYFVDENHNRLNDKFSNEINEIYDLVNNHHEMMNFSQYYDFNLNDDISIIDSYDILKNYRTSKGIIKGNVLDLNGSLDIGLNRVNLEHVNHVNPYFYYNSNGQNIFKRGDVYGESTTLFINVHSGKLKINECDEKTFKDDFVGGTYEVLDQDDEVVDTITCDNSKCISNNLPVGNLRIRVKKLDDSYEKNNHIYDVFIDESSISEIRICSLKKEEIITNKPDEVSEDKPKEIDEDRIEEIEINELPQESNIEVIDIPKTYKTNYALLLLVILNITATGIVIYVKNRM